MTGKLSLDEARDRILRAVRPIAPFELPLQEAGGCVLARDAVAEYDLPGYPMSIADGYAVRAADVHGASSATPTELRLAGESSRGRAPRVTVGWGEAVRVTPGSPIPAGADAVLRLESASVDGGVVLASERVDVGNLVRPAGEDARAGEVLVPAGRRLQAPELGLLAAAGYGTALAHPRVRVAVLSVGDLVEPARGGVGAVRDANSYALVAAARDLGANPIRVGIVEPDALRDATLENLSRADCFVCSGEGVDGAVSEAALAGLGEFETLDVAVEPGGRVGFGNAEGNLFFGLPPEPVALFVAFESFVRPAILAVMGRRDLLRPEVTAVLDDQVAGSSDATTFVPARVAHRDGGWHAQPSGSASLGALARANGLIVLPGRKAREGDEIRVRLFRALER